MRRSFEVGVHYRQDLGGVEILLEDGRKAPPLGGQDRRVMVRTPYGQWVPVTFPAVGALVEALYDNEEVLYPQSMGLLGGDKVMDFLWYSVRHGWRAAKDRLDGEKATKRIRAATAGLLNGRPS